MMLLTAPIFGSKHLLGLTVVFVLYVGIYIVVKRKEFQPKNVIISIAIFLLLLELGKIIYYVNENGSYPIGHLPFHLCSLPLYLYPLLAWCKNDKVKEFIKPAAFSGVLFGGVVALVYPINIIGDNLTWAINKENLLPYVSFVYHGLMIFAAIYLVKSGVYQYKVTDVRNAIIIMLEFALIAIIVNFILNEDFMLLNEGTGSPVAFIRNISSTLYTFTMIVLGVIGVSLFHLSGKLIKQ